MSHNIGVVIEDFIKYLEVERRSPQTTLSTYQITLLQLRATLEERGRGAVESVTRRDLQAFIAARHQTDAPRTLAKKVGICRSLFRWARHTERIMRDPALTLKGPKLPTRLPKAVPAAQMIEMVELPSQDSERQTFYQKRDALILELLYQAGLRVSELCSLNLGDVDTHEQIVRVVGKGNKAREVPVSRTLAASIEVQQQAQPTAQKEARPLFVSKEGRRLSPRQIQNIVKRYGALGTGNPGVHPHMFRHSFATHLLEAGADLRSIQTMLGHASLSTTQTYTQVTIDQLTRVYDSAHPLSRLGANHQPLFPDGTNTQGDTASRKAS